LFCLCLISAAQPEIGAPAPGETTQPAKPVIKRINLNNMTPLQALEILKVEGAFAPFVPKEIIDIVGLQGLNALLVRAANEGAIEQLEQILKILDQRNNNSNAMNLLTAYVIELKYLSPEQVVQMLQGEGSRYKQFVPKEITEIIAIPNSQKLLVQTADAGAALRLTQLISLIDQPNRLALQMMLIIMAPPRREGERQPMPIADGNMPLAPAAVQTWVQSLIDTRRGSVIVFPDQPVNMETHRVSGMDYRWMTIQMPSFSSDIESFVIYSFEADQSDMELIPSGKQQFTIQWAVIRHMGERGGSMSRNYEANLVMGQTTLLPVGENDVVNVRTLPSKRYFLAITPVFIPPSISDLGRAPTTGGGFVLPPGMGFNYRNPLARNAGRRDNKVTVAPVW
jgi:hypothetical protein